MTAAHRERSAASDHYQWPCLPLSIDVVCTNEVLEAIRAEAVRGFNRLSHGGLETGGILFGRQTDRSVEILASQPLDCEHKTGPAFILSEKDEAALQAALADPKPGTLQPIGLYMTHSRRGFSLAEADRKILDRYFTKPWQMALLLMPAKLGPTVAGFFVRSPGGKPDYLCAHEFLLHAPERSENDELADPGNGNTPETKKISAPFAAAAGVGAQSSAVSKDAGDTAVVAPNHEGNQIARLAAAVGASCNEVSVDHCDLEEAAGDREEVQIASLAAPVEAPAGTISMDARDVEEVDSVAVSEPPGGPKPVDHSAAAPNTFRSFSPQEEKQRRVIWWKFIVPLVLVILCAAVAASLWTRPNVVPSPSIPLHISDLGSKLRIEWDPTRELVRAATSATLEIRDGGREPQYLPITRDGLDSGGIAYSPQSEKIGVRLKLLRGNAPASESQLYLFINPVRSADSPPPAPVPVPTPQEAPAVPQPVSAARSEESEPSRALTPVQAPNLIQPPSAPIRMAVRAFNPPKKRSSGSADVGAPASLPDLPEIAAAQSSVPVPLPGAPSIGVRPPPPPAPVAPAVTPQNRAGEPPQPRSGRLIWTGDLRKSGLLSLSPAGASLGVLNGRLPGFPVKVTVQPAELVDGGITVFSSDRARSGTGETPSARNGWNVIAYKWDPKRTSEVTIIEPPGPSNGWRQLVLRNGNHNVSVLVVDWQREGGQ